MKITKRQLKRIIKTASSTQINEWFLSKQKEDRLAKVLAGMRATDEERKKIVAALSDEDDSGDGDTKEKNEAIMTITKRQLRRIIKEEKARVLREQDDLGPADNNTHHWPRVAWDDVGDLVDKWTDTERKAFDTGDPSMMAMGETATEAKGVWDMQVEQAGMEMEAALTARVRKVAMQTMQEFTDRLINGDFV